MCLHAVADKYTALAPPTDDGSAEDVAMPYYTAIVTLLAVAFYFSLATRVSVAHSKFNVRLPTTTGNPDFERIFRAHMNTLEWMPTFLVPLWLCATYLSDVLAFICARSHIRNCAYRPQHPRSASRAAASSVAHVGRGR